MLGLSFKTGTDDLRESPLVTGRRAAASARAASCASSIRKCSLSSLFGANRSYIERNIPHLGSLLCASIEEMIDPSDVILVGLAAVGAQRCAAGARPARISTSSIS